METGVLCVFGSVQACAVLFLPWCVSVPNHVIAECRQFPSIPFALFPVGPTDSIQERVAARHFGGRLGRHQVMVRKAHAVQDGCNAASSEQHHCVDTGVALFLVRCVRLADQGGLGAHQEPLRSEEGWWTRKNSGSLNGGRDQSEGVHGDGKDREKDVA